MSKTEKSFNELDNIRDDLESLKTNVVELTNHIQENGKATAAEMTKNARKSLLALKKRSEKELHKIEDHVKEKPAESLALAFAAGYIASILFRHR